MHMKVKKRSVLKMLVTQILRRLSEPFRLIAHKLLAIDVTHPVPDASMSAQLTLAGRRIVIVGCAGSGKVLEGVILTDLVEYIGRTIGHNPRVTALVP